MTSHPAPPSSAPQHPRKDAPQEAAPAAPQDVPESLFRRIFRLTPINKRRWENFKANRRGYWSLILFLIIFVISMLAEFIANDKPILVSYKGELLSPVLKDYPEEKFGGFLAQTNYTDPIIKDEI